MADAYPTTAIPSATKVADEEEHLEDGVWDDGLIKAEATRNYVPDNDEEIELQIGDLLAIDFMSEDTGWWVGTNTRSGDVGIFPGSHCTKIEWSFEEAEVLGFNDELARLADELEQFEGSTGDSGSNADLLFDSIGTELSLLVPLAVRAGFCDIDSLSDDNLILYFTRQVVAGIVTRCENEDGVTLLNGTVSAGMFEGLCASAISDIEKAVAALLDVPPERSQMAAEVLHSMFSAKPSTSASQDKLGDAASAALEVAALSICAASDTLATSPGLKARWGAIIMDLRSGNECSQGLKSTKVAATATAAVRTLMESAAVKAFASRAGKLVSSVGRVGSRAKTTAADKAKVGVSKAKEGLSKAKAKAYTASMLAMFKMKTHATSYIQRRRGKTEKALIEAAKARKTAAPS